MLLLVVLITCWLLIHTISLLSRLKCPADPVNRCLARYGVSVKPFQLRYSTSGWNNVLSRCSGSRFKHLIQLWFRIGSYVTVISIPISVFILVQSLMSSLPQGVGSGAGPSLAPVLPGVNLPVSEIGLYLLSITCASLFHELGHAIAAAVSDVRVEGVGFALFLMIPVAFVELGTDCFNRADAERRLRIVCAGVWHNLILALVSALLLSAHTLILFPVCSFGSGVTVVSTSTRDPAALNPADFIQSVNECPVTGKSSWRACISSIAGTPLKGYCVTSEFVLREQRHSRDPNKCCTADLDRNLCFLTDAPHQKGICLPARTVVDKSRTCAERNECPADSLCLKPEVGDNRTRLFRAQRESMQSYLYWGSGQDLLLSAKVSECKVRTQWLSVLVIEVYDSLLRYLISFSLALAVLNVVPCVFLDGQFILSATLERVCGDRMSRSKQKSWCRALSLTGSVLILCCLLSALLTLMTRNGG